MGWPLARSGAGPRLQGQHLGDLVLPGPGEFDAPQGRLDPLLDELPQLLEFPGLELRLYKGRYRYGPEQAVGYG